MAVEDFKLALYGTNGSTVLSRLTLKTDGNVSAELSAPILDEDLITKGYLDVEAAPIVHNHDDLYYREDEFVDTSSGSYDAGKPIILDSNGKVHTTMIDVATFIYQGNWTPTSSDEYPNEAGLDLGAFWSIDGLTGDYTFTGGDLVGETITNDDLLIWGSEGWAMTKRDEDMSVYYKLDGSRSLTDSFAGGGFQLKNIADATADSDAMTKGQADTSYAPIGIGGGDFMSDGSVPMSDNFDGGNNRLTNIANAIADSDGLTKGQADATYAPIGGGGGEYGYEKEAMAHFNSRTQTLKSSHGIASIEYMSTGKYRMFFAIPTPNTSYYITGSTGGQGASGDSETFFNADGDADQSTTSCEFRSVKAADNSAETNVEAVYIRVVHPYMSFASAQTLSDIIDPDIGVIENLDGSLRVFNAGQGYTMEEAFTIIGEVGHVLPRENCPDDTVLRDAWRFDETKNEIYIDVERAKEIVIELVMNQAKKDLASYRQAFEEAYDIDDTFTLDVIKTDRQNIRNDLDDTIADINAATAASDVESYIP